MLNFDPADSYIKGSVCELRVDHEGDGLVDHGGGDGDGGADA